MSLSRTEEEVRNFMLNEVVSEICSRINADESRVRSLIQYTSFYETLYEDLEFITRYNEEYWAVHVINELDDAFGCPSHIK